MFTATDAALSAGLPARMTTQTMSNGYKFRGHYIYTRAVVVCTCVDFIAFLWTHGGSRGLSSLLFFAFPANRAEGRGVAKGG